MADLSLIAAGARPQVTGKTVALGVLALVIMLSLAMVVLAVFISMVGPRAKTAGDDGQLQAIMFAFFMVQRALAGTELGKNIVLGICESLMALTFDLAITK